VRATVGSRIKKLQRSGNLASVPYQYLLREYSEATGVDWEEVPPDMETFIRDPEYTDFSKFLWPSVIRQLCEIAEAYEGGVDDICLEEAIGTGKSTTSGCLGAWLLCRLLCIRDPQTYFEIAPDEYITVLNMASTGRQAKRIVFHSMANRIRNSPWFRARNYLPDPHVRSELRFRKSIVCFPGNSSETVALGYNIIYAVLDEANFYENKSGDDVAKDLFDSMRRRITSRFSRFNEGLIVSISSTTHDLSFTRQKAREAEEGMNVLYRRRTIMDMWPHARKMAMVEVDYKGQRLMVPDTPKMRTEYRRNPSKFLRDYFCVAMAGESPYMPPREWWAAHAAGENPWDDERLAWKPWYVPQELGVVGKRKLVRDGRPRFVHIDLGVRRDAVGLAVAVVGGEVLDEAGERRPLVVLEAMAQVRPEQHGGEIDFVRVREMIYELRRRGFSISQVSYDGFESEESLQTLRRKGYVAEEYSVDRDMVAYDELRESALEDRLVHPSYEVFEGEVGRLQYDAKRLRVDHPQGGSKDVSDAAAGAVHWAVAAGVGGLAISWAGGRYPMTYQGTQPRLASRI